MITKGTILALPNSKTENKFLVEIDIFKTAGLPEDSNLNASKQKATLCYPSGIVNNYKVGDVVIVGFENNQMSSPVILGKFYSTIDINGNVIDRENTGVGLFQSLQVSGDTTLPLTTTFKNATDEISANDILVHIRQIANLENKVDNKQDTLISGVNIKTINNESLLGSGNINIGGGSGSGNVSTNDTLTANNLILGDGTTYIKKATVSISDIALTADLPVVTFNESTISGGTTIYGMTVDGDNYNFATNSQSVSLNTVAGNESITVDSDTLTLVTRDTNQEISGTKTFIGTTLRAKATASTTNYFYVKPDGNGYNAKLGFQSDNLMLSNAYVYSLKPFIPSSNNSIDLGISANKWKDLYLAGNLTDGTNSISIANIAAKNVANIFTQDQTIVGSTSTDTAPLTIKSGGSAAYIQYKNSSNNILGYLGVSSTSKPIFWDTSSHIIALTDDLQDVTFNSSASANATNICGLTVDTDNYNFVGNEVAYLTTAPSSANTSGNIIFVVLSSEPSTYYNGYYYIITGSN